MTPAIFDETDLPLEDLAAVGLADGERLLLEEPDLKALLSGRRTDMIRMENLVAANGIQIAAIDAKLSLKQNPDGKLELVIHPIYLKPQRNPGLSEALAEKLERGQIASVVRELADTNGNRYEELVEFDRETNQYITTDLNKLNAPEAVNNEPLTPQQKNRYKRGEEVGLQDGTKLQYTATNREGLRANRIALIAMIILDGGISYVLYQSLKALFGQQHDAKAAETSIGYQAAVDEMRRGRDEGPLPELHLSGSSRDKEYSRGYNRISAR